jgi:hypothetical protein
VGYELDIKSIVLVFDFMRQCRYITTIVLDCNPLGDEGVIKISELICEIEIEKLSLMSVGMSNRGASALF